MLEKDVKKNDPIKYSRNFLYKSHIFYLETYKISNTEVAIF